MIRAGGREGERLPLLLPLRLAKRLWERGGESPSCLRAGLGGTVLPVLSRRAFQRRERLN